MLRVFCGGRGSNSNWKNSVFIGEQGLNGYYLGQNNGVETFGFTAGWTDLNVV